jgi:hypothetical protein
MIEFNLFSLFGISIHFHLHQQTSNKPMSYNDTLAATTYYNGEILIDLNDRAGTEWRFRKAIGEGRRGFWQQTMDRLEESVHQARGWENVTLPGSTWDRAVLETRRALSQASRNTYRDMRLGP